MLLELFTNAEIQSKLKNYQNSVLLSKNIYNLLNNNEQEPFLFDEIYTCKSIFYLLVQLTCACIPCLLDPF